MSGEELKPCPMCGSGPARSEGRFTNASFSGVEVMDEIYHPYVWCGTCCLRTRSCDNVAEAVEVWNERARPLPEQPQEGEWEAVEERAWDWLQETFGAVKPAVELDYAPHQMVAAFHAGHAAAIAPPSTETKESGE